MVGYRVLAHCYVNQSGNTYDFMICCNSQGHAHCLVLNTICTFTVDRLACRLNQSKIMPNIFHLANKFHRTLVCLVDYRDFSVLGNAIYLLIRC